MSYPASPRWLHRYAPVLSGLALIIAMCASLSWQGVQWVRLLQASPQASSLPVHTQNENSLDPQLGQLFGSSAAVNQGPAPSTSLNLTLLGSFVSPDPKLSSAIIHNGSTPKRYQVGDEISSGTSLHSVTPTQVEILRNGQRESLSFPQAKSTAFSPVESVSAAPVAPLASSLTPEQLDFIESDDLKQLRERMRQLHQQTQGTPVTAAPAETYESATEKQ